MNRSWTIAAASATAGAAALSFGLFLAVGKDSLADQADKQVKVITVTAGEDGEVMAVDEARAEAEMEMAGGKGGYLGLSLSEDTKSDEGGARVDQVIPDSPASKAGLKRGDVIVSFGGSVVRGPAKVTEKLRAAKSGDKVALDVRRDGKVQKMTVELGERPAMAWRVATGQVPALDEEQQRALEESLKGLEEKNADMSKLKGMMKMYAPGRHSVMILGRSRPLLGIEMVETTPELREAMGGSKDAGVLVGKVLVGTAAEKGGLKVGDMILSLDGQKVSNPGDLSELIGDREGKTVDLEIVRDKRTMHVKAALPKIDEPEDEPTGPRASLRRIPGFAPPALPARPAPPPAFAPPAPPAPPALPCVSAASIV